MSYPYLKVITKHEGNQKKINSLFFQAYKYKKMQRLSIVRESKPMVTWRSWKGGKKRL